MPEVPSWVTLEEGESIVRHDHPALIPYVLASVGSILLAVIGVVIVLVGQGTIALPFEIPDLIPLTWIGAAVILIGVIGIGRTMLRWYSVEYLLTTQEIYKKRGLVSRTITHFRLDQIQNTTTRQSVLGRVLGYGDVLIATAGTGHTEMVLKHVPDPEEILSQLSRLLG